MSELIHFALIGCGRIALRHIEAITNNKNAKLVAVCDLDRERADEKAVAGNCSAYVNYHEMLKKHPEIDVVGILTPSGMHFDHAADIISNYKKNVMIEKPLVLKLDDGIKLKNLAAEADVRLYPVYQNRFNKAVKHAKQAMQDKAQLGKLRVGTVRVRWCRPQRYYNLSAWRGTWAMDGGVLSNQGIHYLDLLRYLCGDIRRVSAKLSTLGANIEVEDTAVASIEFQNGALGVIEIMSSARHQDYEASVSCVCENGLAVLSGIATNELTHFTPSPDDCASYSEVFESVYGYGHDVVIQGITDNLLYSKAPAIQFDDGLESIKLLHALYRSDELSRWIDLDGLTSSARLGLESSELKKMYTVNSEYSCA